MDITKPVSISIYTHLWFDRKMTNKKDKLFCKSIQNKKIEIKNNYSIIYR